MNYKLALFVAALAVTVSVPALAREPEMRRGDDDRSSTSSEHNMMGREKRSAKKELTAEQAACVRTAVGKRETAVATGFGTFSSGISAALSVRATALSAAWGSASSTDRVVAVRSAWKTYKESSHTVRKTFRGVKKTAWDTFKTDVKACNTEVGATGENPGLDQQ